MQKDYKTRHGCVSKVIHWKLFKKSKFDYMNEWYMYKPESILENETHKILWDFQIQKEHLIPVWLKIKENEKRLCQRTKKQWNMKMMVTLVVIGAHRTIPKGLVLWLEVLKIGGQAETVHTRTLLDRPEYWFNV